MSDTIRAYKVINRVTCILKLAYKLVQTLRYSRFLSSRLRRRVESAVDVSCSFIFQDGMELNTRTNNMNACMISHGIG